VALHRPARSNGRIPGARRLAWVLAFAAGACGTLAPLPDAAGQAVFANGLEVACKSGRGKAIAAFPDVCFTPPGNPATPPGVPVPYPSTGTARDTTGGANTTRVNDKSVRTKGSAWKTASGEDAGQPERERGKTSFRQFDFDVKLEGKKCARQLELPTLNHASASRTQQFPLEQPAGGQAYIACAGALFATTLLPPETPGITYVEPPPFEGIIIPYRSGRIPTPEEVAAYRANPEAADRRIAEDIDRAEAQHRIDWEKLLAATAEQRAVVDARIEAFTSANPEYDQYPVKSVITSIGRDGLYEGEIRVVYGHDKADMWVQRFDASGERIDRPELLPEGNVWKNIVGWAEPGSDTVIKERTDIDGNRYWAKVIFEDGRGYYLFNERGEAYVGEIYNLETGNRQGGILEEDKFPVLADHGAALAQLDYIKRARTDCPVPCQAVTDFYNSIADEMNLIIREMNQHAADHAGKNAEGLAAEENYREMILAGSAENPRTGPEPGWPVSTSVLQWHRARYEGLRETLEAFRTRLEEARRVMEACACPGVAPGPLATLALWGDPYLSQGPAPVACLDGIRGSTWVGERSVQEVVVTQTSRKRRQLEPCVDSPLASWQDVELHDTDKTADIALHSTGRDGTGTTGLSAECEPGLSYPIADGEWLAIKVNEWCLENLAANRYETGKLRQSQAARKTGDDDGDPVMPGASTQWGPRRIFGGEVPALPPAAPGDASVLIAVIDSGVDLQHPALVGRVWVNPGEIPGNDIDDDGNGLADDINGWNFVSDNNDVRDTNGHGTLVAGLIAAQPSSPGAFTGVDPGALIMPLKVTDFAGNGNSVDVAAAVTYAANAGAAIINLSLGGGTFSAAEQAAIDYARGEGVLVVIAAGNQGADAAAFWPAAVPGALTVAASTPDDERAPYSNWGTVLDITAPGTDLLSLRARYTDPLVFGGGDYQPGENIEGSARLHYRATGTSFATPLVAGTASRIWAQRPALRAADVRRMLLYSARDLLPPGPDILTGYGLLDSAAALAADPAFFIEARISGVQVTKRDGKTWVQVLGSADADAFADAGLRLGAGESPATWQAAGEHLERPVRNGVLAELDAQALAVQPRWTLQLDVRHRDGRQRTAQFDLKLR